MDSDFRRVQLQRPASMVKRWKDHFLYLESRWLLLHLGAARGFRRKVGVLTFRRDALSQSAIFTRRCGDSRVEFIRFRRFTLFQYWRNEHKCVDWSSKTAASIFLRELAALVIAFIRRKIYSPRRGVKEMAKAKKKAPKTKRRPKVPKIQVKIESSKRALQDVESTIAEKMSTQPTDLFTTNAKVVIECEHEGGKRPPGRK